MATVKRLNRDPRLVIKAIWQEMTTRFFEMEAVIEGLFVALLSGQNILLIGPPGSAKTQISKFLAHAISGQFFDHLLTKYTVPDELFGPIDIVALRKGTFKRVTDNTLATADVVLLDEIWKASSAIVNYLLRAFNEREYKENGTTKTLPLKIGIACSNEYPQGEETAAIYDRFNLKYETTYISENKNFLALLQSEDTDPTPTQTVTMNDLENMITAAKTLPIPDSINETLLQLRQGLLKEGVILSPRRWKKAVRMVKAKAYLRMADKVEDEDLTFLVNVLWNLPEQRPTVTRIINNIINPMMQKVLEIMDMAEEVWTNLNPLTGVDRSKALVEARAKLASMRNQLNNIIKEAHDAGKVTKRMTDIRDRITTYQRTVGEELVNGTL